ncbi:ZIP family metal transporter [Candidatus Uhrbacteria bacterium]|nr:ZIP family metal transporter [Candidatus Uhrbacteria bacterium]
MTLLYILTASIVSGLVALLLAFAILKGRLWSHDRSHLFLSFAAGTLLALSFLDLIPEAFESLEELRGGDVVESAALYVLLGFLLFYTIEKFILWYHCHHEHCEVHTSKSMILIGDTLHNFLDGIALATAFLVSPAVGVVTTIAIFSHEIPQEVADFSILLASGMKGSRALLANALSSLASIAGALATYTFATRLEMAVPVLTALTAGGFIYIAAADIIPEIHHERGRARLVRQFIAFLVGVGLLVFLTSQFAH